MAYLDDIVSAMKAIAKAKSSATQAKDFLSGNKSIARGALDGTMQFPCLVSDAITIDMASTIARTLERVYASFAQTYLSLNSTIDISVDKNANQFLKKFHKNVKLESTAIDYYKENCVEEDVDYDELMKRIYDGSTKAYINEKENSMILFNFSDQLSGSVYESNKELLEESLKYIDFEPFPNIGNSPFYEADDEDLASYSAKKEIDSRANQNNKKAEFKAGEKMRTPAMTDNDVKKSNDLQPYLMQLRLMAVNNDDEFVQFIDCIVGIKAVLHNIKSEQMVANINSAIQNNGKLFNFIRWTTGEKSLFKDLLLNINDVKLDVANKSKGTSPWFMTLKRLKEQNNIQKSFFSKTQIVPNATIVISSYDADIIQKNFGYDLHNPQFGLKLMKALFLMTFIIVDDGTRTVEILYDGENSYQTYALETLEREVSMNSNKIGRELTRMISR